MNKFKKQKVINETKKLPDNAIIARGGSLAEFRNFKKDMTTLIKELMQYKKVIDEHVTFTEEMISQRQEGVRSEMNRGDMTEMAKQQLLGVHNQNVKIMTANINQCRPFVSDIAGIYEMLEANENIKQVVDETPQYNYSFAALPDIKEPVMKESEPEPDSSVLGDSGAEKPLPESTETSIKGDSGDSGGIDGVKSVENAEKVENVENGE